MATQYQSKKAIQHLQERLQTDLNVQGFGIGRAKDHGCTEEKGYVAIVYVENLPQKPEPALEKKKPVKKAKAQKPAKPETKATKSPPPECPDQIDIISRKKKVSVPVAYVQTGKFSFS